MSGLMIGETTELLEKSLVGKHILKRNRYAERVIHVDNDRSCGDPTEHTRCRGGVISEEFRKKHGNSFFPFCLRTRRLSKQCKRTCGYSNRGNLKRNGTNKLGVWSIPCQAIAG